MTNHQIHLVCCALSTTAAVLTLAFWDVTPLRLLGAFLSLCAAIGMGYTLWRRDPR